jgi:hypothetical protein
MTQTIQPRRNLLFVPGTRPDRFAKALAAGPDMVTVDLEDAVIPPQKDVARKQSMPLFDGTSDGIERVVRINGVRTPFGLKDLALRVCAHLGVDRETALRGMSSLRPEPGAMRVLYLRYFDRDLVFVNAFAANDPESTARIWQQVVEKHGADRRRIALVNCRADRPYRSQQIASAVPQWPAADRYILTGSGTLLFARAAVRHGLDPERLIMAENASMTEIVETILEHSGRRSLIVGMCNIHGGGAEVVRFFENRTLRMTGI